jgi:t-SNARE complex subunit (syntaxin)
MTSLNQIPKPVLGVTGQVVDGEAVLVLPDKGEVKVLNEVGARIWELADGTRTIAEIAELLTQEFEVDIQKAQNDALIFLQQLEQKGVIQLES